MYGNTLGKRIREERKRLNLTQEQLSERANITVYYLGEIERSTKTPSLDVLINISNSLGVSCDRLLRENNSAASDSIDFDIMAKLSGLTPKQKIAVEAIIDAYIKTL